MARTDTFVDAGPLVSYFYRHDKHHEWAMRQMARLSTPLYTCEAVLSEAFHLLEGVPKGVHKLLAFLERGAVEIPFSYTDHAGPVHELMHTYADQPMSFADACLVRMAEIRRSHLVFTVDTDFRLYRTNDGGALDVLLPDGSLDVRH